MGKKFLNSFIIILVFLEIFFIICPSAFGSLITSDLAKKVATSQINILQQSEIFRKRTLSSYNISEIRSLKDENGEILAYVVVLDPEGYIVVSPDSEIRPLIVYSLNGKFSFEDNSDNVLLQLVLWDMENRRKALPTLSEKYKKMNRVLWKDYLSLDKSIIEEFSRAKSWGPYLVTQWHQYYPFNKYCPLDPNTEERSVTGCSALAMAGWFPNM